MDGLLSGSCFPWHITNMILTGSHSSRFEGQGIYLIFNLISNSLHLNTLGSQKLQKVLKTLFGTFILVKNN